MTPTELVQRFYSKVWNQADEDAAREILHENLTFRGSLGPSHYGIDGFIDYMRSIHAALGDYRCIIDDLVATEDRAAARMTFTGVHRAVFFGLPPTGQMVSWAGSAFFRIEDAQIRDIWVLGDVDGLKAQLGATHQATF